MNGFVYRSRSGRQLTAGIEGEQTAQAFPKNIDYHRPPEARAAAARSRPRRVVTFSGFGLLAAQRQEVLEAFAIRTERSSVTEHSASDVRHFCPDTIGDEAGGGGHRPLGS